MNSAQLLHDGLKSVPRWSNKLLPSCGDPPLEKNPVKSPSPRGSHHSPGCRVAIPLGYSPIPLLLVLPEGLSSECSGLCPESINRPPQRCRKGYTAIASHGHCRAVWLAMAAVVQLDNGRFPLTRWRGGACLMADVCPYHVLSGHTAIASY